MTDADEIARLRAENARLEATVSFARIYLFTAAKAFRAIGQILMADKLEAAVERICGPASEAELRAHVAADEAHVTEIESSRGAPPRLLS